MVVEQSARASLAGAIAAGAALATTVLADGMSPAIPSLILSVGQAVIRLTPGSVATVGIESLGTADKPALVLSIVVVCLLVGAWVGRQAARRWIAGPAAFIVFAVVGIAAAAAVRGASVAGAVIAASAGALVGTGVLASLLEPARARDTTDAGDTTPIGAASSRRRFLLTAAAASAGTVAVAAAGRSLGRTPGAATDTAAMPLPRPADPLPALPARRAAVRGQSPIITPNRDFYRIDEALATPHVDASRWRLRVSGLVGAPFELTYDDLLAMPMIERDITLACVSNEVGGRLVGTARWLGVPLADLIRRARPQRAASQIVGHSVDRFTVGFPVEAAIDGRDAIVAVGMNGVALPRTHGFPARLVVPGLYGYVSATKWLSEIALATRDFDAYWIERGWAKEAPIKTQSRIDVPRHRSTVDAGRVAVAGVAWAPTRDIRAVEVRIDNGAWQSARLGPSLGRDAWRQWVYAWDAKPGDHEIAVRATDGNGAVQTPLRAEPHPDGATGHHTISVRVDT